MCDKEKKLVRWGMDEKFKPIFQQQHTSNIHKKCHHMTTLQTNKPKVHQKTKLLFYFRMQITSFGYVGYKFS